MMNRLFASRFGKTSEGFTLLELMMVVAVIGILASVAFPSYMDSVQKSRRVDATNGMLECAGIQERNYTISNTYLNNSDSNCVTQDDYYALVVDNTTGTAGCQVTVNGNTRFNCFEVTATPKAGTSQEGDDDCVTLTLSYTGARTSENSDGTDTRELCWRN